MGLSPQHALAEAALAIEEPTLRAMLVAAAENPAGAFGGTDRARPDFGAGVGGVAGAGSGALRRGHPGEEPRGPAEAGLEGVDLLARAWRLSDRLGAPLAPSVRAVAVLVRADIGARRAVATAMTEARATVVVLVALPLLGPVLAMAVGVAPGDLYGSVAGIGSGTLGLTLVAAGMWWIRRLLRQVARAGDAP